MLNCMDVNMTVLERQRARFKWQQQQQQQPPLPPEQHGYYSNLAESCTVGVSGCGLLGEVVSQSVKPDSGSLGIGWPDLVIDCLERSYDFDSAANLISNSSNNNNSKMNELNYYYDVPKTCTSPDKMSGSGVGIVGRESLKKRKADKVVSQNETWDKRNIGCGEEKESKITQKSIIDHKYSSNNNQNKENSADTSKQNNSKITEFQKPDYIHVRARRGQATDSHSLAERVRREKISERMKYLQDLVPGCNKITGKAGMLDEIINYVQSLQRQVEFLSMKLAAVNPKIGFNFDSLFSEEAFPACSNPFPTIGMETDIASSTYLQFNPFQQPIVTGSGLDMGLEKINSTPISVPETFVSSPCLNIQPTSIWDADLQILYNI